MSSLVNYGSPTTIQILSPAPTGAGGIGIQTALTTLVDSLNALSNLVNTYTVTIYQPGGDDCEGPSAFNGSTVLTKNPARGTGWYTGTSGNGIALTQSGGIWSLTITEVVGCEGGGGVVLWRAGAVLDRIVEAYQRLNTVTQEQVGALEKNY